MLNNKGITLIALVITIIVLLILAGVSIAMLTGENGILTQATNAKEETTKVEEEEKIKMAVIGSSISDNGRVEIIDETSFKQELQNQFGNQQVDVETIGDGSFIITVTDTQRKYYVNDDRRVINSDNIIEITTVDELKAFRDDVNNGNNYEGKVVLLTNDINLDEDWIPIGRYDSNSTNPDDSINKSFRGIFDGKFHKINGITINSTEKAKGLFALVKGGTIKNIGIESGNISSNSVVGGIVAYAYDNSRIANCYNKANITITDTYVGGIIGYAKNNVSIESCYSSGIITGERSVGGICGGLENNAKIINCYNIGNVNASSTNPISIGGIVGGTNVGSGNTIKNSYSMGIISSTSKYNIGGIIGTKINTDMLENNYFLENTVNGGNVAAIIEGTESKTVEEMKEIYNLLGNKFKKDSNGINNGYPILFWQ